LVDERIVQMETTQWGREGKFMIADEGVIDSNGKPVLQNPGSTINGWSIAYGDESERVSVPNEPEGNDSLKLTYTTVSAHFKGNL